MKISLKDYDLEAAKERMRQRISRERGLGGDFDWTQDIRQLRSGLDAAKHVGYMILRALDHLPAAEGGTASPVGPNGEWWTVVENLRPELPLVRALLVVHAYPNHPGFHGLSFKRPGQLTEPQLGPVIETLYQAARPTWSVTALEQLIFEGACRAFGDRALESTWLPDEVYPGSRIGNYMYPLHLTMLYDVFGALDPAFSRRDALIGEWWLLQPVSPRLVHHEIAARAGLELAGFVPPAHLDAAGRVVMACYERDPMDDDHRIGLIERSKWIAGWQKVTWAKTRAPLSDPAFDLIPVLEGVTETSYGPHKHSSELPPWPAAAAPGGGSAPG